MRNLKLILIPLALLVSHPLWSQTKTLGPRDYPLQVCSSTPPTGFDRQCADQTTGNLICVNALGGSCAPNPTIASGSVGLPTTAVPANSCGAATTATASGALSSDTVAWSFSGDVTGVTGWSGAIVPRVWTTANTVNVKLCNITTASVTPGAASINWSIPGRAPQVGGPAIQHHSVGSCATGTTCAFGGQIVGATGDAAVVQLLFCWNAACSGTVTPACTLTVTDGTNTYTQVSQASYVNSTTDIHVVAVFVAAGATAGTYTVTAAVGGTGCSINFGGIWFLDVSSVSPTSPVDTVSSGVTVPNSGTAISLTSPGAVSYANTLMLGLAACWNNGAFINAGAGAFTALDTTGTGYYANFYQANTLAGSTPTLNATCSTSAAWSAGLVGLHP